MSIKRHKDTTNLVARFRLRSSVKPHYVFVYIWKTQADLVAQSGLGIGKAKGCHIPNRWYLNAETGDKWIPPLLGEIHFIVHDWDEEIVSHELMHSILHRIRVLKPDLHGFFNSDTMEQEEDVCYEFGRWFDKTWRALWKYYEPYIRLSHVENISKLVERVNNNNS